MSSPHVRTRNAAAATALVALIAAAGCGANPRTDPPYTAIDPDRSLELLGEFNVPPLTIVHGEPPVRFGGVSGLAFDHGSGDVLGISDDHDHTRVFVFHLPSIAPAEPFRVNVLGYVPLARGSGAPDSLDGEGIAVTRDGRLFIASEGRYPDDERIPSGVLEYTRRGEFVGSLPIPEKFQRSPQGPSLQGVRSNAAFESLTLTPGEQRLVTATEAPLVQDGPEATVDSGAVVRLLEYVAHGDRFLPAREFAYRVEPLGRLDFEPQFATTGLVELVALSDTEFVAMERGFASEGTGGRALNRIRIFRVSMTGATDVSGFQSIRGRDVAVTQKTLLLDLSTLTGLSAELATLENFEGMALGPTLADGSRTLLIVSDDNFNPRQRTSFLLFRMVDR